MGILALRSSSLWFLSFSARSADQAVSMRVHLAKKNRPGIVSSTLHKRQMPTVNSLARTRLCLFFICHNKGNSMSTCYSQVGIDESEVNSCLNDSSRMKGLLTDYINKGSSVRGTPYEFVND